MVLPSFSTLMLKVSAITPKIISNDSLRNTVVNGRLRSLSSAIIIFTPYASFNTSTNRHNGVLLQTNSLVAVIVI